MDSFEVYMSYRKNKCAKALKTGEDSLVLIWMWSGVENSRFFAEDVT